MYRKGKGRIEREREREREFVHEKTITNTSHACDPHQISHTRTARKKLLQNAITIALLQEAYASEEKRITSFFSILIPFLYPHKNHLS